MSKSKSATWASLRAIVADRDGYRCHYCHVPTATTIEHVRARTRGGGSYVDNLVLACPYCNRKKGTRDIVDFLAAEDWRLHPPTLPSTTAEMLNTFFGIADGTKLISTGSTNAKLSIENSLVSVLVRARAQDQWRTMILGDINRAAVVGAAWDFLTRHDTPAHPRKHRPPPSAFARKRKSAIRN
jgi:hypothetical protein